MNGHDTFKNAVARMSEATLHALALADRGLSEPDAIVELSYRRRARALMLFCLSDDFFLLREAVGLAIPK